MIVDLIDQALEVVASLINLVLALGTLKAVIKMTFDEFFK